MCVRTYERYILMCARTRTYAGHGGHGLNWYIPCDATQQAKIIRYYILYGRSQYVRACACIETSLQRCATAYGMHSFAPPHPKSPRMHCSGVGSMTMSEVTLFGSLRISVVTLPQNMHAWSVCDMYGKWFSITHRCIRGLGAMMCVANTPPYRYM